VREPSNVRRPGILSKSRTVTKATPESPLTCTARVENDLVRSAVQVTAHCGSLPLSSSMLTRGAGGLLAALRYCRLWRHVSDGDASPVADALLSRNRGERLVRLQQRPVRSDGGVSNSKQVRVNLLFEGVLYAVRRRLAFRNSQCLLICSANLSIDLVLVFHYKQATAQRAVRSTIPVRKLLRSQTATRTLS
jgi:hypothetical protein